MNAAPSPYQPSYGTLPPDIAPYGQAGPFDQATIPHKLLNRHRTKAGTYGLLTLEQGSIDFVWDCDGFEPQRRTLNQGESIVIPPQVWHHLEVGETFRLRIDFLRSGGEMT